MRSTPIRNELLNHRVAVLDEEDEKTDEEFRDVVQFPTEEEF